MAVASHENIAEMSDRELSSMRNRETGPVEFLCSMDALAKPHPVCTTRAERFRDRLHRACTAIVFPQASECFVGSRGDFRLWAKPSISGSDPRRPRVLLHRRFHS